MMHLTVRLELREFARGTQIAMPVPTPPKERYVAAIAAIPVATMLLTACVSQSAYDELQTQNRQLQAQNQHLQGQLATLQAQASFVETGDLLFPPGGYELSAAGKAELANNIAPRLRASRTLTLWSMAIRIIRRSGRSCSKPGSTTI